MSKNLSCRAHHRKTKMRMLYRKKMLFRNKDDWQEIKILCRKRRHRRLASLSRSTPGSSATLAGIISTSSPRSSRFLHLSVIITQFDPHLLSEPKQEPAKGDLHFPPSDHRHLCSRQRRLLCRTHSHWTTLLKCCCSGRFIFTLCQQVIWIGLPLAYVYTSTLAHIYTFCFRHLPTSYLDRPSDGSCLSLSRVPPLVRSMVEFLPHPG